MYATAPFLGPGKELSYTISFRLSTHLVIYFQSLVPLLADGLLKRVLVGDLTSG